MARRSSLLTPSTEPVTTHRRRRSVDDRLLSAVRRTEDTPITATVAEQKGSRSRPVSISSSEGVNIGDKDDENDPTDYNDKVHECNNLLTPNRLHGLLSLRPRSETVPRAHELITPKNVRPGPEPRVSASAPAVPTANVLGTRARLSPQEIKSPCGRMSYVRRINYEKHISKCEACITLRERPRNIVAPSTPQLASINTTAEATTLIADQDITSRQDNGGVRSNLQGDGVRHVDTKNAAKAINEPSSRDIHIKLLVETCTKLTPEDKNGFLYIFKTPAREGLVKIGYTNNPVQRINHIKRKCELDLEIVHFWQYVDNIKRIELLAKKDLDYCTERWYCPSCRGNHKEWFKVDEDQAISTVEMWVKWLAQEPYTKEGELTKLWEHLLKKVRIPVPFFGHHDHEARRIHWQNALRAPDEADLESFRKAHRRQELTTRT
jgi:hypothetical protein